MVKYFAGAAGERWKVSYIFELYAILGRHRKGNETDRQKNKILTLKP